MRFYMKNKKNVCKFDKKDVILFLLAFDVGSVD